MSHNSPSTTTYAIAHGLIGFQASTLRVVVTRTSEFYAWVTTADLLDAGTKLVLEINQISTDEPETVLFHKNGLVAF